MVRSGGRIRNTRRRRLLFDKAYAQTPKAKVSQAARDKKFRDLGRSAKRWCRGIDHDHCSLGTMLKGNSSRFIKFTSFITFSALRMGFAVFCIYRMLEDPRLYTPGQLHHRISLSHSNRDRMMRHVTYTVSFK
jgi:hypothetical protein